MATPDGAFGVDELREQGIAATRQLAKRQLTWLRGMENAAEFDCLAPDLEERVMRYLRLELEAQVASG